MPKIMIVPELNKVQQNCLFAKQEGVSFEYDDFFLPSVLVESQVGEDIAGRYQVWELPNNTTLHGAFLDVTIFSQDPGIREVSNQRVEQSLIYAKMMNSHAVIFHTNYLPTFRQNQYRKEWVNRNKEYWMEKCEKYPNINIYMENMFDTDPELIVLLAQEMKKVNNFGICLDYAHAALSMSSLQEWIIATAPYVKHIHVNDNDLISDLHLELGTGKIDWDEFASLYNQYLSKPSILLELNGLEKQKRSLYYLRNKLMT